MKKLISMALAVLFAVSLSLTAQAAENPFGMSDLDKSSLAMSSGPDGKCGGDMDSGKCGGDKKKDGKCGADKKKKDGKCGDGKCGSK